MYELDAPTSTRTRSRSRAIPTTSPRRCSAASSSAPPTGRRSASTRAAGLEGVIAIPPDPVPTAEARAALPDDGADRRRGAQHRARVDCSCSGLAKDDFSLIGARPGRPHPPGPRARTSTRARWSWSRRADELGAVGATISGAGPDRPVLVPLAADRHRLRGAPRRGARLRRAPRAVRPGRRRRKSPLMQGFTQDLSHLRIGDCPLAVSDLDFDLRSGGRRDFLPAVEPPGRGVDRA